MGLLAQDAFEQLGRVGTDGMRPVHHARRRPFQMGLMTLGAMLALSDGLTTPTTAQVGSDPCAPAKDLDRGGCRANFHYLLYQSIGHAVEVSVEGNVVIDVDGGARPLAQVKIGR